MSFMIRIALLLLLVVVIFSLSVQLVLFVTLELLWPNAKNSVGLELYGLGVAGFFFLFTLLLIGWYLGKPIYGMIVWIRQLANGNYEVPESWIAIHSRKKDTLKRPYALYKELYDHLLLLTNTLKENHQDKLKSEQVKQEWIQGISHDLKTPLTYISGYSAMLLNPGYQWSEAEQKEFQSVIGQKAAHLQELVQDLNENIHTQIPIKLNEVDLIELVRRTLADVSSAPWASGYSLMLDSSETLGLVVSCDSKLLMRSLRNLLVNAIVHNPEGTEIEVHIKRGGDQIAEIDVVDNGIGINDSLSKGENATSSQGRSGLGLSIAKQLIEAHGGKMSVMSQINKGTSISIKLPLAGN
ncbi:sensor histidine kinase [Paenibacillus sepulcri]|uniref:histidine kinase n=1 Tax=Paenibacillus sepulcri TaxID=359917 RepID=A0ABS7C0K5_9BACL|nr:HAMP domain-containing histidine kinase [Paenibacillus sepulcri]